MAARAERASSKLIKFNLFELNERQRDAVMYAAGPLLVLAGAGSGKTRVITYRIARLLLDGTPAKKILAVTFTNKAAREMRERLCSLVGQAGEEVELSTFHALGLRILKQEYKRLGLPRNFSIYDSADQMSLVRDLLRHHTVADRRLDASRLLDQILALKKKQEISTEGKAETASEDDYQAASQSLLPTYLAQMRAYGAIDFDDLIGLSLEVLQDPSVASTFQERYAHLLVDEYQDTSPDQLALIKALAGGRGRICVVGDDDQAIYGWRGAAADNIASFSAAFEGVHEIVLDQNYRSTNCILQAANQIIAPNIQRRPKKLWSALGEGFPVQVTGCNSEDDEAEFAAESIHQWLHDGFHLDDIAILFRANSQSRLLEQVLLAERLPHRIVGGQALFDRKDVRDATAFLSLAVNCRDEVALRRVINVPPRGLGPAAVSHLSAWAQQRSLPLWEALCQADSNDALTPQARQSARGFAQMMTQHAPKLRNAQSQIEEVSEQFFNQLGLRDSILSANDSAGVAANRVANLESVVHSLGRFARRRLQKTAEGEQSGALLADFLRAAALRGGGDHQEDVEDDGQVTLMSIHAAKGLEFPCVLIVGLEEDLLPHRRSIDDLSERGVSSLAEERRLLYVGMTRAREQLKISFARERTRHGRRQPVTPSRFLDDLPQDPTIVQRRDRRSAVLEQTRTAASEQKAADFFAKMRAQLGIDSTS